MSKPFAVRDFDGISPGLTHPEKADAFDGKRALEKLVSLYNQRVGVLVIPLGAATVTLQLDEAYANALVMATLNAIDVSLLRVVASVDSDGLLTVTGNANATADVEVTFQVFDI